MRKHLLLFIVTIIITINTIAQTYIISPDVSTEQCPSSNITFTVTLPGINYTAINVTGRALTVAPTVVQQPGTPNTSTGNTVFTFIGKFLDYNNSQTFTVNYNLSGTLSSHDFTFTKVKSLLTYSVYSAIHPNQPSITANRCQSQNFTISFNNVNFSNKDISPEVGFGTIATYEYLLPVGWVLNGTTSTGGWIAGGNNVTVTSDLSNGVSGNVSIRAVNPCGASLAKGPQVDIPISRPAPTLTITSSDNTNYLCSGTKTYTINGMPTGATVVWTLNNTNVATIPANSTSQTVTVTKTGTVGTATLTATVSHCIFSYPKSAKILIGAPQSGSEAISSISNLSKIFKIT